MNKFFLFSANGNRLVTFSKEENKDTIMLYNTVSLKEIKTLAGNHDEKVIDFTLHSMTKKICTISQTSADKLLLQLWNLDDGNFIREREIQGKKDSIYLSVSTEGRYLFINYEFSDRIHIMNFSDLKPAHGVTSKKMLTINYRELRIKKIRSIFIVYWREGNDVKLWHVSKRKPILLKNIKLGERDSVSSSDGLHRAVIWGPQRPIELWDVKKKKRLRLLTSRKNKYIQFVKFTMNDTAVVIKEEGGLVSLFDAKDGSPLAQHISAAEVYYYDSDLRRIHVWNDSGQVIRYVEGRSYFGYFVPTRKGAWD
ncbi:hypothetical protein KKHLCK_15805 [Candidatus Electrothrix laxa]